MIPMIAEDLRRKAGAWPVADLRAVVAKALPTADTVTVALVADWLLSEAPDGGPPLTAEQVGAIWRALHGPAQ